ncbi:MAG: ferredoxin [Streptococcaceae bacterium]|nr:ferredoxin [Streptococcaceae bacterium]
MKMKIIPEKCIACGLCHQYAPEVFDYNDAGIVRFYGCDENKENKRETKNFDKELDKITKAVKLCPTGALALPK